MKVSLVKILLIIGTLCLTACSGVSTSTGFYSSSLDDQQSMTTNSTRMNFGGGLGSSFNQYSMGLMDHD
jgi:uncharacterized lipoprotein YmbA